MMMIAQAPTPDPVALAAWLGILAFILMLFNQGGKAIDRLRGQPPHPPNEVLGVTGQELARRVTELEEEANEADARRKAIYTQIDKVRLEMKSDMQKLDDKIGSVPAVIIALLKNTGVIK